jgi:hypothetical protein
MYILVIILAVKTCRGTGDTYYFYGMHPVAYLFIQYLFIN